MPRMRSSSRWLSRQPIDISRDVWTSPALMLTLSSRDFAPRSGAISYRLKGLKRGEPDATLMRLRVDCRRIAGGFQQARIAQFLCQFADGPAHPGFPGSEPPEL